MTSPFQLMIWEWCMMSVMIFRGSHKEPGLALQ